MRSDGFAIRHFHISDIVFPAQFPEYRQYPYIMDMADIRQKMVKRMRIEAAQGPVKENAFTIVIN